MYKVRGLVLAFLLLGLAGFSSKPAAARDLPLSAAATIRDATGRVVGNALFTAVGMGTVRVQVWAGGLPPGEHGIHVHAVGACTPDFAAAGPHFNPTGQQHGLNNPAGPHAGDLPALVIGADGNGMLDALTPRVSLATGARSLFDGDGSAIVIHARPDDQVTDPSGNTGDRIACGVIGSIEPPESVMTAAAAIRNAAGAVVGNALFTAVGAGTVRVQVWAGGLPPGEHGIHVHAVGACTPDFAAAGPHFNPTGQQHGLNNPAGPHAGDLPALVIGADGNGMLDALTPRVSLATGARSLFDGDGSAIVIHARPDDQVTDPSGNTGDRIACGVIGMLP